MAASLAHEIKNPLAAIKGMAQMLDQNVNDPEFIADFRQVVPKEINRLNNLVDNLLKLGKTNIIRLQSVNINIFIEDIIKLYDNCLKNNGIRLIKELNPVSGIKADPEQLAQVLNNLIINAIQAMPDGGEIEIKTSALIFKEKENIVIEVSDTGIGITEDKLKDIFEPFVSSKDEGMGLGLAISYKIIKDHGGEIEVESRIGQGTTFRLYLPILSD
jgi:two-component system NtrC family sensor kinase